MNIPFPPFSSFLLLLLSVAASCDEDFCENVRGLMQEGATFLCGRA